ncbi:hypothetical protein [Ammonifex thiophilus]|nr:hypothetical protein [Ammonifex thiophilus]
MEMRVGKSTKGKKVMVVALLVLMALLFLRSTILRVEEVVAPSPGSSGLPAVTLGFLVLFLAGVCYGLWVLLVEHYLAFSLAREWLLETLRELEIPSANRQKERKQVEK